MVGSVSFAGKCCHLMAAWLSGARVCAWASILQLRALLHTGAPHLPIYLLLLVTGCSQTVRNMAAHERHEGVH